MLKKINKFYLKQRFIPNIISVFINPFYIIRRDLYTSIKKYSSQLCGKVLDYGCGSKPYEQLFSNVTSYIGIDIDNPSHDHIGENIDVYFDGLNVPFEDGNFDSILATEVLEHVEDIDRTLIEMKRVLRIDGILFITVPFVWGEHELPYDFRRFTGVGIMKLLENHNFEVIECSKVGCHYKVLSQMWMMYLHDILFTKNKYINIFINVLFISPFCLLSLFFNIFLPKKKNIYFNTIIIARSK